MVHYNPLFHDKTLKLLLPQDAMSDAMIHHTLTLMGYELPDLPYDKEVIAYILPPQDTDEPCSFIVIQLGGRLTVNQSYNAGLVVSDSFDHDELDFDFFVERYGRR